MLRCTPEALLGDVDAADARGTGCRCDPERCRRYWISMIPAAVSMFGVVWFVTPMVRSIA